VDAWERFWEAIHYREIDHIPVVLWCSARCFASLSNMSVFDLICDPRKKLEAQLHAHQLFPDATFVPGKFSDYGDIIELASALGARIYWSEDSLPFIRGPLITHDDDIDRLVVPDPWHDGFLAWTLYGLRKYTSRRDDFRLHMHFVESLGPGELAGQLWGLTTFLMNLYLKPDLCLRLLEKTTEIVLAWLEAQEEALGGADVIVIGEDIPGLMSEGMYRKYLFPFHRLIRERHSHHTMLFHCDTKADHLANAFADVGVDIWHIGPDTDLASVKHRIGSQVVLMGNVDPVHVLQEGDVHTVKMASQACVDVGARGGRFLLAPGGGLNYGTPPENIQAMIDVAKANKYES
jgi:uroporphyrinogen decarboxylase